MEDHAIQGCKEPGDEIGREYRKKSLWLSFKSSVYSALGGAAFIGLLGTIATALVRLAVGGTVATEAASMFGTVPLLVMGGLMAIGTACLYMSNKIGTDLRCIQDEHLAYQNAKKMGKTGIQQTQPVEQPENKRCDGKGWVQAVDTPTEQVQPAFRLRP